MALKKKSQFTPADVHDIAKLASIPVTSKEEEGLAAGFTKTMQVVDQLFSADVVGIAPTHHVTGLANVSRDDEVDSIRTFTQEQALQNAKKTHNGFIVVERIIEE